MAKHAKATPIGKIILMIIAVLAAIALAVAAVFLGLWLTKRHAGRNPAPAPITTTAPGTEATTTTVPTTTVPPTDVTEAPATTTSVQVVFKELTFSSPSATVFTTSESTIAFLGSTDPRSTLTMNGKAVELSPIGGFSVDVTLQPGVNTFRFTSGSKTVTFQVTYKVNILHSVTPGKAVTVDSGGSIQIRATGHKDAALTATFNGQTKSMSDAGQQYDPGSDYRTFQATFSLPSGTVGQKKNLGGATVTAKLRGLTKSLRTAAVYLAAEKNSRFVVVTRDYAETFAGSVVNDFSRPTSAYLPAGTVDRIVKSGSAAGHTYYLLGCGRWVYTEDVKRTKSVTALNRTALTGGRVTVSQEATTLTFGADWKIPYNLQLAPQSYAAPNADVPDYAITQQTTEYVDITFYYIKRIPSSISVGDSPLFASAQWVEKDSSPVLRLYLRKKGQFYGYSVHWSDKDLTFSFKHPRSAAGNPASKPLQGIRIVLDPGHGGSSSGTYGTIKGYYEKTATLDYSFILQRKLKALGAQVVMTRTTDILPDNPTMATRTAYARNNGTDLLLSIHMNGSKASSANGCTLHYFNEYSHDVARRLTGTMRAVEKRHGIGNREKVTIWSPFFMARLHDCPAVLVECGFMTNAANMNKLINSAYKNQLTDAIVEAVVGYFRSLPTYTVKQPTTTTRKTTVKTTKKTVTVTVTTTTATTTQVPATDVTDTTDTTAVTDTTTLTDTTVATDTTTATTVETAGTTETATQTTDTTTTRQE